jgi:hypothetical protein
MPPFLNDCFFLPPIPSVSRAAQSCDLRSLRDLAAPVAGYLKHLTMRFHTTPPIIVLLGFASISELGMSCWMDIDALGQLRQDAGVIFFYSFVGLSSYPVSHFFRS